MPQDPTYPSFPDPGRDLHLSLRLQVLIRWCAAAGQSAAVAVAVWGLNIDLPLAPVLAMIGALMLANLNGMVQIERFPRMSEPTATAYLAFDLVQLAGILGLTGGLTNPFCVVLLAPLTVAAAVLRRHAVALLVLLAVLCITIIARWYVPLRWPSGGFDPPALYFVGLWTALCFAAVFIATYVWRVASEARHNSAALAATQLALAREQKVSAVGAIAAALAHELGTPLGTIAIVAKELSREVTPDDPLREDIDLLQSQSDRCREILANLSRRPDEAANDPHSPTARAALGVLIEEAAAPHRVPGVRLRLEPRGIAPQPSMPRGPEMLHGLGNLLQNAQQFAHTEVVVELIWDARLVRVVITDDGPGFPPALLPRLGEPYLSARQEDGRGEGHGLGIYIAKTLLARTGATLTFANRRKAGGEVAVEWRRQYLEG